MILYSSSSIHAERQVESTGAEYDQSNDCRNYPSKYPQIIRHEINNDSSFNQPYHSTILCIDTRSVLKSLSESGTFIRISSFNDSPHLLFCPYSCGKISYRISCGLVIFSTSGFYLSFCMYTRARIQYHPYLIRDKRRDRS